MPGAQIFAQCMAGTGSTSLVRFKSSITPQKHGVQPGKLVTYRASIKNVDKDTVVQGLAVTVQLPVAGVAYVQSKASHAYVATGAARHRNGKAAYRLAKGPQATANHTSTPVTVTWSNLTLPPHKGMRFSVRARVSNQGVFSDVPLVFAGGAYQQLPVNGQPYCTNAFVIETAQVRVKG